MRNRGRLALFYTQLIFSFFFWMYSVTKRLRSFSYTRSFNRKPATIASVNGSAFGNKALHCLWSSRAFSSAAAGARFFLNLRHTGGRAEGFAWGPLLPLGPAAHSAVLCSLPSPEEEHTAAACSEDRRPSAGAAPPAGSGQAPLSSSACLIYAYACS